MHSDFFIWRVEIDHRPCLIETELLELTCHSESVKSGKPESTDKYYVAFLLWTGYLLKVHFSVHCLEHKSHYFIEDILGTILVVQWLRLHTPNAGGPGFNPDQETRSHMQQIRHGTAKSKNKYYKKKMHYIEEILKSIKAVETWKAWCFFFLKPWITVIFSFIIGNSNIQ